MAAAAAFSSSSSQRRSSAPPDPCRTSPPLGSGFFSGLAAAARLRLIPRLCPRWPAAWGLDPACLRRYLSSWASGKCGSEREGHKGDTGATSIFVSRTGERGTDEKADRACRFSKERQAHFGVGAAPATLRLVRRGSGDPSCGGLKPPSCHPAQCSAQRSIPTHPPAAAMMPGRHQAVMDHTWYRIMCIPKRAR